MAKRRSRDLAKESRWRKVIARQGRSGQTVRQYCQENSLSESAFWFWKRELARRDAEQELGPNNAAQHKSLERRSPERRRPKVPSLVPVTIGPALTQMAPIEVSLPRGVSVRVAAGCDEATLRMVLAALETA